MLRPCDCGMASVAVGHGMDKKTAANLMLPHKKCTTCFQAFPATSDYFSFSNRKVDGTANLRGTCKKCMAENTARHSKERPDLVAARAERRRAFADAAQGTYTAGDIAEIRKNLNDECYYCGTYLAGGGDVDHMLPLSKGGTNWPANLTLACKTCNLDKHAKSAEAFFVWRQERNLPVRLRSLRPAVVRNKWQRG